MIGAFQFAWRMVRVHKQACSSSRIACRVSDHIVTIAMSDPSSRGFTLIPHVDGWMYKVSFYNLVSVLVGLLPDGHLS